MWPSLKPLGLLASACALFSATVGAEPLLKSSSLNTCQANSGFTASLFNVVFKPNDGVANVDIVAVSSIQGSVLFDVQISAYGYTFLRRVVNPCDAGLAGLCPMTAGKIPLTFNLQVSKDAAKQIPGIAYSFPDLDAKVRVFINMTSGSSANTSVACVEAEISNGKTVDLLGVKWATAVVAGLALASSAVVSGLGHSNAASHVAANALSLVSYFQAQAMVGLCAVSLPPAAQSWTQDFQWSIGIIRVGFMQTIFTWYQRATGGTPSTLFDSLTSVSVEVAKRKRSLDAGLDAGTVTTTLGRSVTRMTRAMAMAPRAAAEAVGLAKRADIDTNSSGSFIVHGIQRVAFRASIEPTNVVMTGLTFFCIVIVFVILVVSAFKGFCELAARQRWIKNDTFLEFRNGWLTVLKGILFRMSLIAFPPVTILSLYEFTQVDSAAEVVLAVFFFFGLLITLAWAASKVIRIARRSVAMHHNPAYILFSDPQALNKWGFLYVQFRASAYYYILPMLAYTLIKGMFVAFAQKSGTVQAIAFLLIEAAALIAASVLRPWMDKSTNSFNIAICVINFLNAIFMLIFSDVFNQPALVTGIVGVVLWIANAVFSLVLLIMLIVTTVLVFFRKNPDNRYQFMADDRASFMKSQTHLTTTTELDALAATARGDKSGYKPGLDLDDDNESISSDSMRRRTGSSMRPPSVTANSISGMSATAASSHSNSLHNGANMAKSGGSVYRDAPRSPVDPSMPLFPADTGYGGGGANYNRNNAGGPMAARSPSPYNNSVTSGGFRPPEANSAAFRAQNNASPVGFRSAR